MFAASLFSIETNQDFGLVAEDVSPELATVLGSFEVGHVNSLRKIDKMNRLSDLYVADCEAGQFILRFFSSADAGVVEQQCRIVNELRGVETLRPRRCSQGSYVFCISGSSSAAMLYPFIHGPVFLCPPLSVTAVGRSALNFLIALREWQNVHDTTHLQLPKIVRNPELWSNLEWRISNIDKRFVSKKTRELVEQNRPLLRSLLKSACGYRRNVAVLSHCDLQHANLVIGTSGPAIIDLEDICFDDMAVCAAHAIFKIARHSVFLGLFSTDTARQEIVKPLINYANEHNIFSGDFEAVLAMAAHRTLGDIHNILAAMEIPETSWMSYDLEKKINNLFEIGVLFEGEG